MLPILRHAARQQELDTLFYIAHGLKSAAKNLEATQLYKLTMQLEKSARNSEDDALLLANDLASQLELFIDELDEIAFGVEIDRPNT